MYFEVLCLAVSEGGSDRALQMNAFSILVVLIKKCVCVYMCVFLKENADLQGVLEE